jgi:hypothetical protein
LPSKKPKQNLKNETRKAAKETKRDHMARLLRKFAKHDAVQPEDLSVS